jgi:hypothetical protein
MRRLKQYKLIYRVGGYLRPHYKRKEDDHDPRLKGLLECKAYSILHATVAVRNVVGHQHFEITEAYILEANHWRKI